MNYKLILSTEMRDKLEAATSSAINKWNEVFNTREYADILNISLKKIKETFPKLNITEYEFSEECSLYNESNFFFGYIKNNKEKTIAYLFFIPITYQTRSGVLAQQVFPVMSGIMKYLEKSPDNHLTNRPIFIINLNEENFTPAMALNVLCGNILNFHYVDIYDRDIFEKLQTFNVTKNICTIEQLNKLIIEVNGSSNEYFELDSNNKKITFLIDKLGDGTGLTNQPYWFVLKAYAAAYLADKQKYTIDMSIFNTLTEGNKTLDAFRKYIEKIKR